MWKSLDSKIRAKVPEDVRVYAIGDVHGRADLLDGLLFRIDAHLASSPIRKAVEVYLGDYVDRGPGSREVVDRLTMRRRTHSLILLKGNHEAFLTGFINDPTMLANWQQVGGLATLISYGLQPPINADKRQQIELAAAFSRTVPDEHRRFLEELRLSFTCGDFFFVHAGVRPGVPLSQQREEDLLWIRDDFLLSESRFDKIIIHGHTPVLAPDVRSNRINIDTGAYATGKLTCLVLEGGEKFFI